MARFDPARPKLTFADLFVSPRSTRERKGEQNQPCGPYPADLSLARRDQAPPTCRLAAARRRAAQWYIVGPGEPGRSPGRRIHLGRRRVGRDVGVGDGVTVPRGPEDEGRREHGDPLFVGHVLAEVEACWRTVLNMIFIHGLCCMGWGQRTAGVKKEEHSAQVVGADLVGPRSDVGVVLLRDVSGLGLDRWDAWDRVGE